MNHTKSFRKRIALIGISVLVFAAAVWGLYGVLSRLDMPEKVAKSVLTEAYSSTPQEAEKFYNAVARSAEDENALREYLTAQYGELLTENGYSAMIGNRISAKAADIAKDKQADVTAVSVTLAAADADEGTRRYAFTVVSRVADDASQTYTFKGYVILIPEDDQWKVDVIAPM